MVRRRRPRLCKRCGVQRTRNRSRVCNSCLPPVTTPFVEEATDAIMKAIRW